MTSFQRRTKGLLIDLSHLGHGTWKAELILRADLDGHISYLCWMTLDYDDAHETGIDHLTISEQLRSLTLPLDSGEICNAAGRILVEELEKSGIAAKQIDSKRFERFLALQDTSFLQFLSRSRIGSCGWGVPREATRLAHQTPSDRGALKPNDEDHPAAHHPDPVRP